MSLNPDFENLAKNNDGWISIAYLATRRRLKALTRDTERIVHVLQGSNVLELSTDKQSVRPRGQYPIVDMNYLLNVDKRSLFIGGFPFDTSFGTLLHVCESAVDNSFKVADDCGIAYMEVLTLIPLLLLSCVYP